MLISVRGRLVVYKVTSCHFSSALSLRCTLTLLSLAYHTPAVKGMMETKIYLSPRCLSSLFIFFHNLQMHLFKIPAYLCQAVRGEGAGRV